MLQQSSWPSFLFLLVSTFLSLARFFSLSHLMARSLTILFSTWVSSFSAPICHNLLARQLREFFLGVSLHTAILRVSALSRSLSVSLSISRSRSVLYCNMLQQTLHSPATSFEIYVSVSLSIYSRVAGVMCINTYPYSQVSWQRFEFKKCPYTPPAWCSNFFNTVEMLNWKLHRFP